VNLISLKKKKKKGRILGLFDPNMNPKEKKERKRIGLDLVAFQTR
jgi:hypothetical protein